MKQLVKAPAKSFFRALGYYPVKIKGRRFKADPFHIGFWREVNRRTWEPQTFDILDEFLDGDSVFVDVGAWIGPTVLFGARKARKVFCFEPDTHAYQFLLLNLQMNRISNVTPFNFALAEKTGLRQMGSAQGLGTSHTSLVVPDGSKEEIEVYCVGWSDWINIAPSRIDFIKIDIEGGEFELVPAMKEYLRSARPTVYLSLHAPFIGEGDRRQKMAEIAEVMSVYGKCYDEARQAVTVKALANTPLDQFNSFLFTA